MDGAYARQEGGQAVQYRNSGTASEAKPII